MKKANKAKVGLILAFAAALSCSSVVAITKICTDGGSVSIAMADTAVTVTEKSYTAEDIASLWASAVEESVTTGEQVTFVLPDNWTAQPDSSYTTSFGSDDLSCFSSGRIKVPAESNMVLDLNGYTIDRGLASSEAVVGGSAIYLGARAKLEIIDSSESETGLITGGNTTSSGGGVYMAVGSELVLNGGRISGNKASISGGGVGMYAGTSVTVNGGEISENEAASSGGGVYMAMASSLVVNGGKISDNKATGDSYGGGGICIYGANGTVTINGGEISGNSATTYNYGGGGIFNYVGGTVTINGGEIYGNTAENGIGGGIYNANECYINGGEIYGNTAAIVGGVYNEYETYMTGGTVTGNSSTDTDGIGSGVYNAGGDFYYSGGVVLGNSNYEGAESNFYSEGSLYINGKLSAGDYLSFDSDRTTSYVLTSGYTSKGNSGDKFGLFFGSASEDYELVFNGTEVEIAPATSPVTKDSIDWSFKSLNSAYDLIEEVTVEEGEFTKTVAYTGGAFTFDAMNDLTITAVNANGRPVTSFVNVGTYTLSVKPQEAANYVNPFFTLNIVPADISEIEEGRLDIETDNAVYTGNELTTSVRVFLDGVMLEANKDYTVSFKDNVNAGEGTVIITALGNYTGTVERTFTINKATLGVRYGLLTLTYNGEVQGIEVYPEGLYGDDEVTLTVKYFSDEACTVEVEPQDYGTYWALITLEADNYEFIRNYKPSFEIVAQKVDVIWENTQFVYNGAAHELTADDGLKAYFTDVDGNRVYLTVNAPELTEAGYYEATAELPASGYENYVLTQSTLTGKYTISKAEVEAVWGTYELKYDGNEKETPVTLTGINGEDLTSGLTYTYYDEEGKEVSPVDAGTYKVVISLTDNNYVLTGKTEETFTISQASLEVTLDSAYDYVYSGEGKNPLQSVQDEYGEDLDYTLTFAPADENGNATGAFTEDLPINVGNYILKVEVDAENVEQSEYTTTFEITQKTVSVAWEYGDNAANINGVVTYLYDGTAHLPKAYYLDDEGEKVYITVTGTGKSVGDNYKTVASYNNANYKLDGDLEVRFNVIKSLITGILWYEYGSTEPVAADAELKYEYISVFGQEDGARLSAYGVLTPADLGISWTSDKQPEIKLNVTYDKYFTGYWDIGTYTATASLSSTDSANFACDIAAGLDNTIEFEVTAITHSASTATIKWVIEVDGKHKELTSGYEFTYNGEEQAPMAILLTAPKAYDPDDPDPNSYIVLHVGGARTDAGTYYAYIVPNEDTSKYEIKEEDSEFKFVIVPSKIAIDWEDKNDDGEIVYVYNGEEQAPKAYIVDENGDAVLDENGDRQYLEVAGNTVAGTYFAIAEVDGNYEITNDNFIEYTIEKRELSVEDIVWGFEPGDEGDVVTDVDGVDYFVWEYNGNVHTPTATLEVTLVDGNDPVKVTLSVTGGTSAVGTHYAYVTLDSTVYANANYMLEVSRLKFEIVQDAVEIIWEDANADGEIVHPYDGKEFTPKAYYIDGEGNTVYLTVVGSGTNAGNYVACITDDLSVTGSKTVVFKIQAKALKAVWTSTRVTYSGETLTPDVTFYETVTDEDGNVSDVKVNLKLGVDYTVSGYTNAGTYTSAVTFINGNYAIGDGSGEQEFVIRAKTVTLVWTDEDGNVPEEFVWDYNGEEQAPKAYIVDSDGNPVLDEDGNKIFVTVMGAETNAGVYTAVAVIDDGNYTLSNPEQEYSIKGSTITVVWTDEDGNELEEFAWEYDGFEHKPYAHIGSADGALLEVIGTGIYVNENGYTAYAVLPANCEWADKDNSVCNFTITKRVVQGIVWSFEGATEKQDEDGNTYYELTYDGAYHSPAAKSQRSDELAVQGDDIYVVGAKVNVGEYEAEAKLANTDNYVFADGLTTTVKFVIVPQEVVITWYGEGGRDNNDQSDFDWEYNGEVHCPTAWFENADGEWFEIPVTGGSSTGGEHWATASQEVYNNYKLTGILKMSYRIIEVNVSIDWNVTLDEAEGEDGVKSYSYTCTYNGKDQTPKATVDGNENVLLNYLIVDGEGNVVGAIINAGTYTVTVTPSDKNYAITEGVTTITVVVEKKTVNVVWGDLEFVYNGLTQSPKAWFVDDANGLKVTLEVEGAGTEVDTYTATITSEFDNFVLSGDTEVTFEIVKDSADEYVWDWDANDGLGGWVPVSDENVEETPDPVDPVDPVVPENPDPTDPDDNDKEEGEGGDGNGEGETGGSGENEGTTPADPENPNPNPDNGDNEAVVPGQGGDETGKDGEDDGNDDTPTTGGDNPPEDGDGETPEQDND